MSTPTYEPTVFVDLTRDQIVAILNGGTPPAGAHPLSAAEMNRLGVALQVLSQNLNGLQGTAQTATQVQTAIQAAVATLIGGAPAALDTFVELANALGNDPNKITALSTAIAAKYTKPGTGIPAADLASDVPTAAQVSANTTAITAKYTKPGTGIPAADLASDVPTTAQLTAKYTKPGAGIPATDLAESYSVVLPSAATVTASTTVAVNTAVQVDATAGDVVLTLPAPTKVGQRIRVRRLDSSAYAVSVTGTINGVTATVSMPWLLEIRTFVAESTTTWSVESGNTPKTALDGTYAQQTGGVRSVTGPTLPTLTAGTFYIWMKTDPSTGALLDIVNGVA